MNSRLTGSIKTLLTLTALVSVFHLLVITKILPRDVVAGGFLTNDLQLYAMEVSALTANLFFGYLLLEEGGLIKRRFGDRTRRVLLWVFFALFAVNSVANLFGKTVVEKSLSLVVVAMCVALWRVNTSRPDSSVSAPPGS